MNRCGFLFRSAWLAAMAFLPAIAAANAGPGAEGKEELALGGDCPVAYQLQNKAVEGDPQFQSSYAGRQYRFSDAEAKKAFDENPEKFLPQFDGRCTMALGGPYGNRLPSDPEVFLVLDGKLYLFSSERAKRHYLSEPSGIIENAERRFARPAHKGACPVSYQTAKKAVKGDPKFSVAYQGYAYHLASAEAKTLFIKDPAKYAPRYLGYCARAVAKNLRHGGKPQLFRVVGGRTYLFHSETAREEFDAQPAIMIKQADANWVTLREKIR